MIRQSWKPWRSHKAREEPLDAGLDELGETSAPGIRLLHTKFSGSSEVRYLKMLLSV